ncbi:Peroxiredoxin-2 [Physocladia obscura]|uniref:Peroxiredoxin-2 n=1 Tax=Physocladia obscura TaxID=109957 RepID=A0AAD5XGZ4_9FUNG|nr:Peroxiredoxin-2 [Physocladia obscura]
MAPKRKAGVSESAKKQKLSETVIELQPQLEKMSSSPIARIGHPAPQFKATAVVNKQFKEISLAEYKGKWVVLFFYPMDFTFVCPTEIIAYSEAAEEFKKINVEIVGASVDSQYSHLAWINQSRDNGGLGEMKIPLRKFLNKIIRVSSCDLFLTVADVTKKIATDYGVLKEDEGIAFRGTFIIDPKQNLRQACLRRLNFAF